MAENDYLTREQKKALIDHEFSELDRVGKQRFGGWESEFDKRIGYDLSVLLASQDSARVNPSA